MVQTIAGRRVMTAAMFLALATAAGCVSDPEPQQMARTSLETAPADLQLLCASAAATQMSVDSAKVLPLSSRRLDSKNFQVDLDAGGTRASCIVDADGNVTSVQPV